LPPHAASTVPEPATKAPRAEKRNRKSLLDNSLVDIFVPFWWEFGGGKT